MSYTVEKATEVVANMSETAQQALAKAGEASDYLLNLAGSFIQGSTLDEFKGELADEKQYPESFSTENGIALLGDSPTDIKDGVVLTASTLGIGVGLLGVKKASSHGGDGKDSSGSIGDGVGSATTNINAARLNNQLTSEEITSHHAWDKHSDEFPELNSKQELQQHIENVINNPTSVRYTSDGRTIYLDSKTKTVVIRNATNSESPGTAWRPSGDWDTYIKNAENFGDIPKVTSPQATTPQLDLPKKGLEVD